MEIFEKLYVLFISALIIPSNVINVHTVINVQYSNLINEKILLPLRFADFE